MEEKNPELRNFSGSAFLALMSPPDSDRKKTRLGQKEEFGVEDFIKAVSSRKNRPNRLYFLINSPGGSIDSAYKIAKALQAQFSEIVTFVIHKAASGGTLLAISGNEIVIGPMGNLTPLDPLSLERGSLNVIRGYEFILQLLNKASGPKIAEICKKLVEKEKAGEMDTALSSIKMMEKYATDILQGAGFDKGRAEEISGKFVRGFLIHEQVLRRDELKEMGLNISSPEKYPELWKVFREWIEVCSGAGNGHIVRYVLP
jgi:ATP-dependent protease ClpP protease subunit